MYRLTVIPSDGAVYYQDQEQDELRIWINLDFSSISIPSSVHALQWLDGSGWIEYPELPNEPIEELPQWALDALDLALNQNN